MFSIPITSIIAAIFAITTFVLSWIVSMRRAALGKAANDLTGFSLGDAGDEILLTRRETLRNFCEYVPICLLLLLLIEVQGATATLVWTIGGLFVLGRILHAFTMLKIPNVLPTRIFGMLTTYTALLIPAGWLLLNAIR